jgi:antitoxin (DNA-binding transcriptional repressor) of toxin-antitoxin stability system
MTLTIAEAQARLPDLIHNLSAGEEVAIIENNRTVARLIASPVEYPQPIPGRGKGVLVIHSDDDEYLEDFKEYMP